MKPAIWRSIRTLDGGQVILASHYEDGTALSLQDINRNIFRLDKAGNVVWQVRRDEQGKLDWARLGDERRSRYHDGVREPFMSMLIAYGDGKPRSKDADSLLVYGPDVWEPGCVVYGSCLCGHNYEIDIEAGVARNITSTKQKRFF